MASQESSTLFGRNNLNDREMEDLIRDFVYRAFRRPVDENEMKPFLTLLNKRGLRF